ncbi:MAG: hypothetical protein HFJ46_07530 [Clostridia bacterium]|nr:hypothetical protein [Clostridia bacterium]
MGTTNLKKFKLNNSVLKDFDALMSMHLDKVEELTVSEIDADSKLLNIIGLCINIKTLIIEGDQRINTNNVILNICKPEILEALILNNVKLPTGKALSRLTGIKLLSLNNIRYNNVGAFLKEIENPENLEGINLLNVDLGNESVSILNRFTKVRYLNLMNLKNYTLDKLDFLSKNRRLEKLNIKNAIISPKEINKLIKGGFEKNILLEIDTENKPKVTDTFEIKDNIISLTVNTINLEEIIDKVQLAKVNKLVLVVDKVNNIAENIQKIKSVRNNISLAIKDVSYITKEEAILFEDKLCVKYINIIDAEDEVNYNNCRVSYEIKDYIRLREEIEKFTSRVEGLETDIQKFLKLYRLIAEEIKLDNLVEEATTDITNLENALIEKKCLNNGYAEILQNCLACVGIEARIISGETEFFESEEILWNQVKLDGKWYNTNLLLDCKSVSQRNTFKRKARYCLLSDDEFYKTHTAYTTDKEIVSEGYDQKAIDVYIKTETFNEGLFISYLKNIISKFSRIFNYNKAKALPEGSSNKKKVGRRYK